MAESIYSDTWMEAQIERLLEQYPFCRKESIGRSVMGKTLPALGIGKGAACVCYVGAVHANEWITMPLLLRYTEAYARAVAEGTALPGALADAGAVYEQLTLWVIPMLNPDGAALVQGGLKSGSYYERAEQIGAAYPQIPFPEGWKANIEGVDLNLQFPAGWELARQIKEKQGYRTPAPRDYVGEAPLSAPESRALYEFTMEKDPALILAYHTQGQVIYWKYGTLEPKASRGIADYFGAVSGYLVEETPAASGNAGYKDWFILQFDRPGYTIEAGYGENPLPISSLSEIYERNIGILAGGMTEILHFRQNK